MRSDLPTARAVRLFSLCLLGALSTACTSDHSAPQGRPNLILITVDTLRADHLGVYGYPLATSPQIDRLAREGIFFAACYSQSAATGPSHASLFTSRFPQSTGVLSNKERFPALPSLMSALGELGYVRAGFVSSIVLGRKFGIQEQFDHFDDETTTIEANRHDRGERPAEATLAAALAYLRSIDDQRPFFLWVHLIDPHGPYGAPREADRFVGDAHYEAHRRTVEIGDSNWVWNRIPAYQALDGATDSAYYVARYDAEIRYVDDALSAFFASLRQLGLYDQSLITVTADHGETLGEPNHRRPFSHGTIAYEEVVRVPWIVKEPAGSDAFARLATERPVTLMDMSPTLLAAVGGTPLTEFAGRNLLGESGSAPLAVFSFGAYGSSSLEREIGTQFTLRQGRWRYLLNTIDGSEELYDHSVDGGEETNLAERQPELRRRFRGEFAHFFASTPAADGKAIDESDERQRQLRSLGYL